MHDFLFTFKTTHQALKGEKYLKSREFRVKLIPTPFEIFAECGFSLQVELEEDKWDDVSGDNNWNYAESFLIILDAEGKKHYEKV